MKKYSMWLFREWTVHDSLLTHASCVYLYLNYNQHVVTVIIIKNVLNNNYQLPQHVL